MNKVAFVIDAIGIALIVGGLLLVAIAISDRALLVGFGGCMMLYFAGAMGMFATTLRQPGNP